MIIQKTSSNITRRNMEDINIQEIQNKVTTSALIDKPVSEWRAVLAKECQVYVCGENYIAKRFDQINYKFCEKNEAREILIDNLYALLRFKYFPVMSDEVDDRINMIVKAFTSNLKSTLIKVSYDTDTDCTKINLLPDACVAFRNGVFDFKNDRWLFKYTIINIKELSNKIYLYNPNYTILWYLDFNFEPLPINVNKNSLDELIDLMKELTKTNRNYCFELLYNMSHDEDNQFSMKRFEHLCEVLGYTCLQSFCQQFVLLIGSGGNGKNSLFDGCFTNRLVPSPAINDFDSIEHDRFVTGSLQNKPANIFLETEAKTYTESKMIKALTGSMYQMIESKGVSKYSGIINCKYIFAGNDQEKIKFTDTTDGFRRRINMFEIFYKWDSEKRFLKTGDYYDTTFSGSLSEIKSDLSNNIAYVYFAMYGIKLATVNFSQMFKFTRNDWRLKYTDVDVNLKDKIESITPLDIYSFIKSSSTNYAECKSLFYDTDKTRLYNSDTMKEIGYDNYEQMLMFLKDEEVCSSYFAEHDVYISLRLLQMITGYTLITSTAFTQNVKKLYNIQTVLPALYNNKPYCKCTFVGNKLRILQ